MSSTTSGRSHKRRRNSLELFQYAKRLQERYILHPFWIDTSMGKINEISHVPDVDIAEAGCCKYILIEVRNYGTTYEQSKLVVRGDASCAYHADLLDKLKSQINQKELTIECIGGGRIRVDPATRTISVYGQSQEFGEADHQQTVEILKKKYPQWTIEVTDDEY
ncbi:unnamed protein product [Adineta steineri]|uniref:14 kDa phosphohistidine phosphatase n=1 Tax=Adineta steineri TaxID=433720 RepID=A0A818LYJ4_9BILA|nr:unnamed protein product [Adineta steineri]CAF3586258.1 unnamed protein product [Adineta steineri]CAF3674165.1 unnamed protein product [Adineta steineri]